MPQLGLESILGPEGRLEAGGKLVRTGHGILPMSRLGPSCHALSWRRLPGPHLVIHGQDMDGSIGWPIHPDTRRFAYPKGCTPLHILNGMGMT